MAWDDEKIDDEGLTPAGRLLASEYNDLVTAVKARVLESLYDANTILKADADDTPTALTIDEQRLVGRITAGVITGLTAAQVRTLLNVEDGADVTDTTRFEAIENDIDYPTAVKQKAITDTGEDGGVEGGVFNGDFEYGSGSISSVGWIDTIAQNWGINYKGASLSVVTASFDAAKSHSGSQSLKLAIASSAGSTSDNNIWFGNAPIANPTIQYQRNLLILQPSTKYRLSGWVYNENEDSHAQIALLEYDSSVGAGSAHAIISTIKDSWEYVEVIFTSDADAAYGFFRIGLGDSIATSAQNTWFDNIKLEQIDTQAVNTQVDEIVSVSVEGVTTTDNVDQYLETSGQTYTLTTGIDEGATHRQTFTPTADRDDGKHIFTKVQVLVAAIGTGDWTLVIHNAANDTLASKTIANGSMSTGDIDFDVPCIMDVGTAYHFHVYSTVADGTVTTTTTVDLETVDYHAQFSKHTESPIISANGGTLNMTGVKLLTGATITVNADGSGRYEWAAGNDIANDVFSATSGGNTGIDNIIINDYLIDGGGVLTSGLVSASGATEREIVFEVNCKYQIEHLRIWYENYYQGDVVQISSDGSTWQNVTEKATSDGQQNNYVESDFVNGYISFFLKIYKDTTNTPFWFRRIDIVADLDCQAALPIFTPSAEVTTEAEDLTLNPIDISEDGYWQLNSDLTGWGSRTFSMLASEAAFESQAASANYIYMYDSNGTTPWTWDERNGLVPPADRTSGTVTAKFLVGDNQIKSSVNDGSMKANVNLSWAEKSIRQQLNDLIEIANLQFPIVVEVEDVPAIDVQDQPTGASAETGYVNDVASLRQTAAGAAAIAYTGLLPREDRFSEWLDITVVCSDGDGTVQGKLYTVDGTLIETYADLESNPVISISNPDYKYSRERLILQISASSETTSTAWSVTGIKWRYQYNGWL